LALNRRTAYDFVSIASVTLSVIIPQAYLQVTQVNLDWIAFLTSVALPICLAIFLFWFRGRKILFLVFVAYIWAVTEDAPVFLDSVYTWPEVTSGLQHSILEIIFHILTVIFMILAYREALKGTAITKRKLLGITLLGIIAYVLSYAQNIPLVSIQEIVQENWLGLDLVEHVTSITILGVAIRKASIG
jgi:hypothetical protein